MNPADAKTEWLACSESVIYFLQHYGFIYDATEGSWIRFHLWRAQAQTLRVIFTNLLVVILKARQLGLTWLCLGFALWLMLFRPAATVLLFSRRDDEAVYLVERLKGMYIRLPEWMQARAIMADNDHEFRLSNGSVALGFPTTAGDSYTATFAFVDEADLVPDLNRLMRAVKPTIDGGGRMVLLSRVDKSTPNSEFKRIYRAARAHLSTWASVFLPWFTRPSRDADWYAAQKADILTRTGSLDDLHEQYPATDIEALAPRSLDKRLPGQWLEGCFQEAEVIQEAERMPAIPGLEVWKAPEVGRKYVIGVDPAEGNPGSDDSSLTVLDLLTGEQVASLAGKFEPSAFGGYINQIGLWYRGAGALVERNNHGHAVILWLKANSKIPVLTGSDGRAGWITTALGKTLMYDELANALRDHEVILHGFLDYTQLASIEGNSLNAPEGEHDDRAVSFALAHLARVKKSKSSQGFVW